MKLFKKNFSNDEFNYLNIELALPRIGKLADSYVTRGKHYYIGADFPTKFTIIKDEFYFRMSLRVLGFGVIIERQNGY